MSFGLCLGKATSIKELLSILEGIEIALYATDALVAVYKYECEQVKN
jgi:hypothetical protein